MTLKSSALFAFRLIFPRTAQKSSARRSVLGAIVCIGISLVPLIVVLSVSEGMIGGMTQRIIGLSSSDLECFIPRKSAFAESPEKITGFSNLFRNVSGVEGVFPQIETDGLAAGKSYRTGARIRAVDPEIFLENKDFASLFEVFDGDINSFVSDEKSAVIGTKMAELLNLQAGSVFRLITTDVKENGAVSPKVSSFKVAAIVSSGYQEMDALWIFIPLKTGFSVIPQQAANYSVMIKTSETFSKKLAQIQADCETACGGTGIFYSWKELNSSQFENFSSTKVLLIFIMFLIVLVAAVNISSAIVMLVMERRREIAILKSIGGTERGITVSFLLAGLACGFCGILTGLPLGLLLAVNANELVYFMEKVVNFFSRMIFIFSGGNADSFSKIHLLDPAYYLTVIPVSIPFAEIFAVCVSVLILSLVVSVLPAVKAGKEKPLDIFRKS